MVSRADRSTLATWWWTVDRVMLALILVLILFGVILSFAASPPVARDLNLADEFHFVKRQLVFLVPALGILLLTSALHERLVRRLSLGVFLAALMLMAAALFIGPEIKGSRRWITLAGFSLQPSEFLKPAFVVLCAWLFSENERRPDLHANLLAIAVFASVVLLLVAQPDIGQTMLLTVVWGALFFMAGLPWLWILALGGVALGGLVAVYFFVPHVTSRIDRFLDPSSGDTHQVDTALQSFIRGGWFGQGPGEGTVKQSLPDSHTDFIFAVAAEEFGIIFCLGIVAVFSIIVVRGLLFAFTEEDRFRRLAVAGLVILLGIQAGINMGVNLQLLPAKGMTLPFISYGGSSLISAAFAMGLVLAMTRKRPKPGRFVRLKGADTADSAA